MNTRFHFPTYTNKNQKKFGISGLTILATLSFSGFARSQMRIPTTVLLKKSATETQHHPKQIDILHKEIQPDSHVRVANGAPQNVRSYFINGVWNSLDDSNFSARLLANTLGRSVHRFYNKSNGVLDDLLRAGAGKISTELGILVESVAQRLTDEFAKQLRDPSKRTLDIHSHSQGSILVENALHRLRNTHFSNLSDEEWVTLTNNQIRITTYGAAERTFPVDNVTEFIYLSDPVALGTFLFDIQPFNSKFPNTQRIPIPGNFSLKDPFDFHKFRSYIGNYPKFETWRLFLKAKRDGKRTAEILAQHLRDGMYSDSTGQRIVENMLAMGTPGPSKINQQLVDFAMTFNDRVSRGLTGNFKLHKFLQSRLNRYAEQGGMENLIRTLAKLKQDAVQKKNNTEESRVSAFPIKERAPSPLDPDIIRKLEEHRARAQKFSREIRDRKQRQFFQFAASLKERKIQARADLQRRQQQQRQNDRELKAKVDRQSEKFQEEMNRETQTSISALTREIEKTERKMAQSRREAQQRMQINKQKRDALLKNAMNKAPKREKRKRKDEAKKPAVQKSQSVKNPPNTRAQPSIPHPGSNTPVSSAQPAPEYLTKDQLWKQREKLIRDHPELAREYGILLLTKEGLWQKYQEHIAAGGRHSGKSTNKPLKIP